MSTIMTPENALMPKMISFGELTAKLGSYLAAYPWAYGTIGDLWAMGAPDPQNSICPEVPRCDARTCLHVKRVLLPNQFKAWWAEVQGKIGEEVAATTVLIGSRRGPVQ